MPVRDFGKWKQKVLLGASVKALGQLDPGWLCGGVVLPLCLAKTLHIRRVNDLEAHPRRLFDVKILG